MELEKGTEPTTFSLGSRILHLPPVPYPSKFPQQFFDTSGFLTSIASTFPREKVDVPCWAGRERPIEGEPNDTVRRIENDDTWLASSPAPRNCC